MNRPDEPWALGVPDRVWQRLVPDPSGCWLWTGAPTPSGYGEFNSGAYGHHLVHRFVLAAYLGGLTTDTIDHLCRVRLCANPAHMEEVTRGENIKRGEHPAMVAWRNGTCTRGHPASEFYRRKSNGEVVLCRACRRENRRALRCSA